MIKHYLTTSLLSFRRHWITAGVNVLGLSLGLLCFIGSLSLIHFYNLDDSQFGGERTYFVAQEYLIDGTRAFPLVYRTTPNVIADELKAAIPQLEVARIASNGLTPITVNNTPFDLEVRFADANAFNIFSLPIDGDGSAALSTPRAAVITHRAALRLFGNDNVIGKPLLVYGKELVTIRGVVSLTTAPSHLVKLPTATQGGETFEVLLSMDMRPRILALRSSFQEAEKRLQNWSASEAITYVRLPSDGSIPLYDVDTALQAIAARHTQEGIPRHLFARPISDYRKIGLDLIASSGTTGLSWSTMLLLISIVVLAVATLNYANLVAAIGIQHRRDVGIRRVLGASSSQLAAQQALESLLCVGLALAIAFATLALSNPSLRDRGIDLTHVWANGAAFWIQAVAVCVVVAAACAALPTLAIARVRPNSVLERSRGGAQSIGNRWLTGTQFALAGVLLVLVLVVRSQQQSMIQHARATLPAPIIAIENSLDTANVEFEVLRAELEKQPHIEAVASTVVTPWEQDYRLTSIAESNVPGAREFVAIHEAVSNSFFETLGLHLVAGATFASEFRAGAGGQEFPIVIDETTANFFGWSSPSMAIGKMLWPGKVLNGGRTGATYRVVGVVQNSTKLFSTHNGANATVYTSAAGASVPLVRTDSGHVSEALAEVQQVWRALAPNTVLRAQFLDDVIGSYATRVGTYAKALTVITMIAVGIALLGLLGMAIHIVNRRRHEIGIRRTLGAHVSQLLSLLLKDIAKPIVVGTLIGWPVAYWICNEYLRIYVYRIELTALPFFIALMTILIVGIAVVGGHSLRAARLKPAEVLRHE